MTKEIVFTTKDLTDLFTTVGILDYEGFMAKVSAKA
jgi:hypothetical protein